MILFFLFLTVCVIEGISSLLSQIIREERSLSPPWEAALTGTAVLLILVCVSPATGLLPYQPPGGAGHDFRPVPPRLGLLL